MLLLDIIDSMMHGCNAGNHCHRMQNAIDYGVALKASGLHHPTLEGDMHEIMLSAAYDEFSFSTGLLDYCVCSD